MNKQAMQITAALVAAQELISQINKLDENTQGIFVGNVKHHSEALVRHLDKSLDKILSVMTKEQQRSILAIYDVNMLLQNKINALSIFEQQKLLENFDYICNLIKTKENDRN